MSKKVIDLSSLSLREKIAQMIITRGDDYDLNIANLGIGGIFLDKKKSKEEYQRAINKYKSSSKIDLFIVTDLEGYDNSIIGQFMPFKSFYRSKNLSEINNEREAYSLGEEHGLLLTKLGFNMDFSPVVEYRNNVWPGRTFTGNIEEIKNKIRGYISGLQKHGIIATAKHFPGGSMILDPHRGKIKQHTDKDELGLFDKSIDSGVKAVMVGQTIAEKKINPNLEPATISPGTIKHLRNKFKGLIISDDIDMWGLKEFPPKKDYYERIYIKIVNAGNDIILHTHPILLTNPFASLYKRILSGINSLERAVDRGIIPEERINKSVKRILQLKGYKVI